jgi:hypothetical protein
MSLTDPGDAPGLGEVEYCRGGVPRERGEAPIVEEPNAGMLNRGDEEAEPSVAWMCEAASPLCIAKNWRRRSAARRALSASTSAEVMRGGAPWVGSDARGEDDDCVGRCTAVCKSPKREGLPALSTRKSNRRSRALLARSASS